ncbi:MAG: hypothetical protein CME72_09170 [Halomonadaceae bacterium]|nr:hypothetical protein [Halomonadaceae bacterium]
MAKQIALFDETSRAAELRYQLEKGSLSELSNARKENLVSMAEEIDRLNQQKSVVQSLLPQLAKLQELKDQAAIVDAMGGNLGNLAQRQLQQQIGEVGTSGLTPPGQLDASVSGPFGEANRLGNEMAVYQQQYEQRLAMLREFTAEEYGIQSEAKAAIEALEQQHQQTVQQYEQQSRSAQMQGYSDLFGNLTSMAGQFASEQSGIYRAMFAVSKGFAIADSIVKIQQGIASAASMPFPANIGAMAAVAAQTASIVSTIAGTQMQVAGQAHDGIDSIPNSGTWNLERGERVVDNRTNRDLKQFLDRQAQAAPRNGGGGNVTIHAPITVQAQKGMSDEDAARQGRAFGRAFKTEVISVIQEQKRPGGVLAS